MKKLFNKPTRISLATNGVILLAGAMLGPIYALFVEEIGGSLLDASFAGAAFALVAGTTVLISDKYADKVKQNELIVVLGYVIMGIGFLLYIFVDSILYLLLVQVLVGFGEAIYAPAFDAIYSKHLSGKKRGKSWGSWEALDYFTAAMGAVVGGFIVTKLGFDTLFFIMAALTFGSALYIYLLPRKVL